MSQPADQPVQQALELPKDVSADYETERKAFVRERALRDEISQLASARPGEQASRKAWTKPGRKPGKKVFR